VIQQQQQQQQQQEQEQEQQQQQKMPDFITLAPPFTPSEMDDAASAWSVPTSRNLPNMFVMSPMGAAPTLMHFTDSA
jgi:hypothetical protein